MLVLAAFHTSTTAFLEACSPSLCAGTGRCLEIEYEYPGLDAIRFLKRDSTFVKNILLTTRDLKSGVGTVLEQWLGWNARRRSRDMEDRMINVPGPLLLVIDVRPPRLLRAGKSD